VLLLLLLPADMLHVADHLCVSLLFDVKFECPCHGHTAAVSAYGTQNNAGACIDTCCCTLMLLLLLHAAVYLLVSVWEACLKSGTKHQQW